MQEHHVSTERVDEGPNNDSDDDDKEEVKGAEIQVSVPDSSLCAYELI